MSKFLNIFKKKDFVKSKKNRTFTQDDEPTALAYTDFTKPTPILKGEDAERFIRTMEENEKKAEERAKIPPTKEELEKRLSSLRIMCDFEEKQLEERKEEIKELEKKIEELDGEK